MKTTSKIIIMAAILALLAGCAGERQSEHLSTSYGREGDFNSNNSMPSAW